MEKKYGIVLEFNELNVLLTHCISNTEDKIADCKKRWIADGFSEEDFEYNWYNTIHGLEMLEKKVQQQLFDQGQTILGRDRKND